MLLNSHTSVTSNIHNPYGGGIIIMNWDICKGKTTAIVKFSRDVKDKVVYCIPSYGEIPNFMKLWEQYGTKSKKVAILKGRNRYHSYREWKEAFDEAKDADIIVSHLSALFELYKNFNLPYNPQETIITFDEGDKTLNLITTKEFLVMSYEKSKGFNWDNIQNDGYIPSFRFIAETIKQRTGDSTLSNLLNEFISLFDPSNYQSKKEFYNKIPEIETKLQDLSISFSDDLFENIASIEYTKLGLADEWYWKQLFLDWISTLLFFKDIQIIRNKWKPDVEDIFLTSHPALISDKLEFIREHKAIVLSSASITKQDVSLLRMYLGSDVVSLPEPDINDYSNVLIILPEKYSVIKLSHELQKDDYITFVVNSSHESSQDFLKFSNKYFDIATEVKNPKDFREKLSEGYRVFSIVQSNPDIAMNHRLTGDVCIVRTFIPREVNYYHDQEILTERAIIKYTLQALGRILNTDGRNVALVMPKVVYEILKKYGKLKGAKVVEANSDNEILALIRQWIPVPIMKTQPSKPPDIKIKTSGTMHPSRNKYERIIQIVISAKSKSDVERVSNLISKELSEVIKHLNSSSLD